MQKQDIITQLKIKYGMMPAQSPGFDLLEGKMKNEIEDLHTQFDGTIDKNETQLMKQIEQAKENLRRERQQFIEEVLGFSNDCKELKENYSSVIKLTEDLENEQAFLDEQLIFATENNQHLLKESQKIRKEILEFDKNFNFMEDMEFWECLPQIHSSQQNALLKIEKNKSLSYLKQDECNNSNCKKSILSQEKQKSVNQQSSYAQKDFICLSPEEMFKAQQNIAQLNKQNKKLNTILESQVFEQNRLQALFQDSALNVINKSYTKKPGQSQTIETQGKPENYQQENFLPAEEKQQTFSTHSCAKSEEPSTTLDPSSLYFEQELNEFQQKQIMEHFFANEEVKRYIYDQIMLHNKDEAQQQQFI